MSGMRCWRTHKTSALESIRPNGLRRAAFAGVQERRLVDGRRLELPTSALRRTRAKRLRILKRKKIKTDRTAAASWRDHALFGLFLHGRAAPFATRTATRRYGPSGSLTVSMVSGAMVVISGCSSAAVRWGILRSESYALLADWLAARAQSELSRNYEALTAVLLAPVIAIVSPMH